MNVMGKKTELVDNRQIRRGSWVETVLIFFISTIGITALLLLFPTWSNLSIFAKGEFAYPESIGIIFLYLTFFSLTLFFFSKLFLKMRVNTLLMRYIIFAMAIGANVFLMILVIMFTWIRFDVRTHCDEAKKEYGGSCVEALSKQLDDFNQEYGSRNSAIWTLGQLADNNSLPILNKHYTGIIPKREPLNKTISQYELKKAITWCEKGNITSWMHKGL